MGRATGTSASEPFIPHTRSLAVLARAVQGCRGCSLYRNATQAVLGEGPSNARVMFVGEQPGDAEDKAGRPFVGPAGRVLAETLEEVGLGRDLVYITNAVKHFKFERRDKRRIHDKPNQLELKACRGWLDAELGIIQPEVIVCLGATAAQTFFGRTFRITRHMGELMDNTPFAPWWMATYHPAALLRMPDEAARHEARARFRSNLARIPPLLEAGKTSPRPQIGHTERPPALF